MSRNYYGRFSEKLADLRNQNRTTSYDRLGIATEEQTKAMYRIASNFHQYLVSMT